MNDGNGQIVDIRDVDGIVDAIDITLHHNYDYKSMSLALLAKYGKEKYYENIRK